MRNLTQYGQAVMTLTDVVDDFCLAQNNIREAMILAMYRHGRWAWKDLFRTTMWNVKKVVLEVDHHSGTIVLPDDCEKVYNISVVDRFGRLHPLGFNTDLNTAVIKCLKVKCSCVNCHGENTLCAAIDSISTILSTVTINGHPYTQTVSTRYNQNGTISKETSSPSWDVESASVIFNTTIETICNVEITECGCIKVTQPNMETLRVNFGVGNYASQWNSLGFTWGNQSVYRELIPTPYNNWGQWNYNAQQPNIVHIFGPRGVNNSGPNRVATESNPPGDQWVNNICQVIVEYLTNGETPGTEILVPEYAVNAMQVGMIYQMKFLNVRVGAQEKLDAKRAFKAEKMEVAKYLNPMSMDVLAKLQTNARLW